MKIGKNRVAANAIMLIQLYTIVNILHALTLGNSLTDLVRAGVLQ